MAVTNKNLILRANRAKGAPETLVIKKKKTKEELMAYDAELVRGRFNFNEVSGGSLTFSYKKYGPSKSYTFIDGETYSIPRGVAKHIAVTGAYPVHQHVTNEQGKSTVAVKRMNKRYSFESLAFTDDDDVTAANSNLYALQ